MVDLNVVPLRDGPSLRSEDIPAQLRAMADRIESGRMGQVDAVFVLIPREQDYPVTFGWGHVTHAFDPVIQFDLARHWHVRAAAGLPSNG